MAFANKLTMKVGLCAGGISFLITGSGVVMDLDTFHGGFMDFAIYFGSALIDCAFNGAMAFIIVGVLTLPLLRYLEGRIANQPAKPKEDEAAQVK